MTEIELFLRYLHSEEDLTDGTLANYRCNLSLFGQWMIEQGKTVTSLTPADLRDYKAELKTRYKPPTINNKLTFISSWLRWCVSEGHISQNPLAKVKWLRSEEYAKWLNQKQVAAILSAPTTDKISTVIVFLLNTGLRVSELCDLKVSDIQDGIVIVRWGKGGKRREVPLNSAAKSAIDNWLKVRRSNSDYLFATASGRMTRQVVQWHLSRMGKKLGFRLSPHLLRHTFGKNLVDKGVSLDKVAKLMGHTNINTTAIYTRPSLEDLQQVVDLLD